MLAWFLNFPMRLEYAIWVKTMFPLKSQILMVIWFNSDALFFAAKMRWSPHLRCQKIVHTRDLPLKSV